MFDRSRRAKNGEIHRLLDLFFGSQTEDCPIDFVFVGDENGLGAPWDNPPDDPKSKKSKKSSKSDKSRIRQCRLRMDRKNLPPEGEEQIQYRLSVGHIYLDQSKKGRPKDPTVAHFVHFARPVNPVSLLVDNFRTLAMVFYLINPPSVSGADADESFWRSPEKTSQKPCVRLARLLTG